MDVAGANRFEWMEIVPIHMCYSAGLDSFEQLDQPLAFLVPILSSHVTLRDLDVRDLDFELVHQIADRFAAHLSVNQSPVI